MQQSLPDVCTAQDLADYWQTSPKHVWALTAQADNPIPSFRLGRYIRYRRDAVQAWADGNAQQGTRAAS